MGQRQSVHSGVEDIGRPESYGERDQLQHGVTLGALVKFAFMSHFTEVAQ
jgi:hypothetical protein